MSVRTAVVLALLLLGDGTAGTAAEKTATQVGALRREIVVDDPRKPEGVQIRRARRADEPWADYFPLVYLWPYDAGHYNAVFTTLNQNGRKVQFIGGVVFESGDRWYLVLRGTRDAIEATGRAVELETGGPHGRHFAPLETILRPDPAGREAWIGLVAFRKPDQPLPRIMSSFAHFGRAGGVHDVLDEEQARRRYAVIRDIGEVIERLWREEQARKH